MKREYEDLTAEKLRALMHYDPETGCFTWRRRALESFSSARIGSSWNARMAGKIAGAAHNQGYLRVSLGHGRQFLCHRLAVLYMTGEWPVGDVDHINRNRADNRWENLRVVDRVTNCQNRVTARSDSTTGLLGVSRQKRGFSAAIQVRGKVTHLGTFDSPEAAHSAYMQAKRTMHSGFCV